MIVISKLILEENFLLILFFLKLINASLEYSKHFCHPNNLLVRHKLYLNQLEADT